MVGHRTALAQEQAGRRDRHDDHAANHYLAMSSRMDAAGGRLLALIPGGWLPVGLAGLRRPHAGLVTIDGLDQATLGDGWRRLATEAPQFHENHILTGSLAFNLLMGRTWPAQPADLAAAEALCREHGLGLGELIDRMPAGLMQPVGETAWQLSQGEKSRVHLARALLQGAPLTVLDESFAALDPDNLESCLAAIDRNAGAVLLIAHP